MPLFLKHNSPLRGLWQIQETAEEMLNLLGADSLYIPLPENIRTEKRQQEWLATRLLLKELLGEETAIAYHPNEAPYLPSHPLYISISHTKGYVALLLQEQPFAGIDIEYRGERILKIRERFMHPEEEAGIDPVYEVEHLLIHWCAKEVLFKMIGQEEVDFKKHLHVVPFAYACSGTIDVYETRTPQAARFQLAYQVTSDYVWVWSCCRNESR